MDHHTHFCCLRIGDTFWLEVTLRTVFPFYRHIEHQSGLLQPQSEPGKRPALSPPGNRRRVFIKLGKLGRYQKEEVAALLIFPLNLELRQDSRVRGPVGKSWVVT